MEVFSNYIWKDNSDLGSAVNKQLTNYQFEHFATTHNDCPWCIQMSESDEQLKLAFLCVLSCYMCPFTLNEIKHHCCRCQNAEHFMWHLYEVSKNKI